MDVESDKFDSAEGVVGVGRIVVKVGVTLLGGARVGSVKIGTPIVRNGAVVVGVKSETVSERGAGCGIEGAGCRGADVATVATGGGRGIKPSALGPSNPEDMCCLAVPVSSLENDPWVDVGGEDDVKAGVCMLEGEDGDCVVVMLFRG